MNEFNESFQEPQQTTEENDNPQEHQENKNKIDLSLVVISSLTLVFLFLGFYKVFFAKPVSQQQQPTSDVEIVQRELVSPEKVDTLRLELASDNSAENIITSNLASEESGEYVVPEKVLEPNTVGNVETKKAEPVLVETEAEINVDPEAHVTIGKVYEDERHSVMSEPVTFRGVVFSKDLDANEFIILNNGIPTTVYVTENTEFKIYDSYFSLKDLKSTDIVKVDGLSNIHGTDMEAQLVTVIGVQKIFITND